MKLRTYLTLLMMATVLPVALFAVAVGFFLVKEQRDTFRRGAEERTLAVLTAVDSELAGSISTLTALATLPTTDDGDLATFRERAQRVLAAQPAWENINLALPDGQQVMNLRVAPGEALPNIGNLDGSFERLRTSGRPVVSDLAVGPASRRWGVAVRVPLIRDGALKYVLSANIRPEVLRRVIQAQGLPEQWVGVIVDRNGRIVARNVDAAHTVGQLASQSLRDGLARAEGGWFLGSTIEGTPVYTPYRRSEISGWAFAMGIPAGALDGVAWRAGAALGAGLLAAIALAFGLAHVIGRRMSAPIATLASATEAIGRGDQVAVVPRSAPIAEVERLARTLQVCLDTMRERQERLQHTEERTRSIVNNVVDGIITIDERGVVQTFNPAAESIFGYAAPEVVRQNVRMLMPEPYHAAHDGYIGNYLRTGDAKVIGVGREVSGRRKDGTTFPLDLAVSEFRIGSRRFFTGIVRDITERKRAEEALIEADRHKDEFLAMLGHELRNPLAALTTAAHVLRAATPGDAAAIGVQGVVERQTRHMARIIEDLLDITRVRLGKLSLKRDPLELAQLVSEVVNSSRAAGILEGRAAVSVHLSPAWVDADRARVEQIFSNLLGNSLKFTPVDGAIAVSVRREADEAVLRVSDDGRGIGAESLERIFAPFVQGRDRDEGGLGLGLALVRRLAELHGGSVQAQSAGAGRGALFTVRLPAIAAPRGGAAAMPGGPAALPRQRVLVIEDNDDARQMLREVLSIDGHDVRDAGNGAAGLAAAAEHAPDVVILDIGLPDINGYEVARRLRAGSGGRRMVLIAVTAYGREEDRGRTSEAGFDAHLVKPVSAERLGQVMAELAAGRRTASA